MLSLPTDIIAVGAASAHADAKDAGSGRPNYIGYHTRCSFAGNMHETQFTLATTLVRLHPPTNSCLTTVIGPQTSA
jgi:hypothetical protein